MRASRRKRPSTMTPARITAVVIASIVVLLIGANGYYRYVQAPMWNEQTKIEELAMNLAGLQETNDSYTYVWDDSIWIVEGKDKQDEDVYVWLYEEPNKMQPVVRKMKDGVTKEQLKEKLLSTKPDANLEHIKLGWKDNEPVWELFYSRDQSGTDFYYYDFYRYSDGGFIITYSLPKQ